MVVPGSICSNFESSTGTSPTGAIPHCECSEQITDIALWSHLLKKVAPLTLARYIMNEYDTFRDKNMLVVPNISGYLHVSEV